MNALKVCVKKVLSTPLVINNLLKLHNFSYQTIGVLSEWAEIGQLHPKHRLMDYHSWFIKYLEPNWTILDVGCGNGALAADLAKHCRGVEGIDFNPKNISRAKNRLPTGVFHIGDATQFDFSKHYDAIILSNVLEHIENRTSFLKKLKPLATYFLIRVPMIDRDWITLYKKERGVEYRLDQTHFIEYTLNDFQGEIKEAGMTILNHEIRFGEIYAKVFTNNEPRH